MQKNKGSLKKPENFLDSRARAAANRAARASWRPKARKGWFRLGEFVSRKLHEKLGQAVKRLGKARKGYARPGKN